MVFFEKNSRSRIYCTSKSMYVMEEYSLPNNHQTCLYSLPLQHSTENNHLKLLHSPCFFSMQVDQGSTVQSVMITWHLLPGTTSIIGRLCFPILGCLTTNRQPYPSRTHETTRDRDMSVCRNGGGLREMGLPTKHSFQQQRRQKSSCWQIK